MLSLNQELICDICNQGFCEIIDKDFDEKEIIQRQVSQDERYHHRKVYNNPKEQHNVFDIRDRRIDNIYGEPSRERMILKQQLGEIHKEEEKKNQQQQQNPYQQQQQRQDPRRGNPYQGRAGQNIFDDLFGHSPFLVGTAPSQARTQTRIFQNPHRREEQLDQNDFFGMFFRPFSLGRMFNDQGFQNMTYFQGFDPTIFATNFAQNFSSSSDPLAHILELSAQLNQPHKKPAKKEAVKKLPVVKITEAHCKKKEGSNDLEAPNCTVCMENLSIGTMALFLPCGHIFHPQCIDPWLKEHNTCPVCRYELPVEGEK